MEDGGSREVVSRTGPGIADARNPPAANPELKPISKDRAAGADCAGKGTGVARGGSAGAKSHKTPCGAVRPAAPPGMVSNLNPDQTPAAGGRCDGEGSPEMEALPRSARGACPANSPCDPMCRVFPGKESGALWPGRERFSAPALARVPLAPAAPPDQRANPTIRRGKESTSFARPDPRSPAPPKRRRHRGL